MLRIDDRGNRKWVLRVMVAGRRRDIGLGSAVEVTLTEAREKRDEIRRQIRGGADPIAAKRKKLETPDFATLARDIHSSLKDDWKNGKHRAQWLRTLEIYAFPSLGKVKVDAIDGLAIEAVLSPIWTAKPETARRVKQRIARVLDVAIARNLRPGPNPADAVMADKSKKRPKQKSFAAMPFADLPAFFARLAKSPAPTPGNLALRFLILTAARTGEVLGARWAEIDEKAGLWIVPAGRMKMGEAHRVPLSPAVREILNSARKVSDGSPLIFPGPKRGKPLSNMVFSATLKRMHVPYTAHGFRSSFRDWAEEATIYMHAAKESALAHKVKDKVEAAYRRTDLLEQRRAMMADWAAFIAGAAT
jgi:integrase